MRPKLFGFALSESAVEVRAGADKTSMAAGFAVTPALLISSYAAFLPAIDQASMGFGLAWPNPDDLIIGASLADGPGEARADAGEAYIILTLDDGIVFKIVENQLQTNNSFKLISLNEIYDPYEVHVKEIKEIWKFVNYISNDMPDELTSQEQLQKSVNELKTDVEEIKRIVKKDGR